ncbi:hypothetical protein QVD17_07047 [Tagetes erecta]|uniref:Uncharacterized protein n=1 Tax=Tagetes erecta TaxID=13708 RepID=A0AAD8LLU7_TARER|nr:hypothetical protein QVD17_07047 [Tagetes erecta]
MNTQTRTSFPHFAINTIIIIFLFRPKISHFIIHRSFNNTHQHQHQLIHSNLSWSKVPNFIQKWKYLMGRR